MRCAGRQPRASRGADIDPRPDRVRVDASLYRRMRDAGLEQVEMFPQLATYTNGEPLKARAGRVLSLVSPEQLPACRDAMAQAEVEGTFCVAEPFHCSVGTKPETAGIVSNS